MNRLSRSEQGLYKDDCEESSGIIHPLEKTCVQAADANINTIQRNDSSFQFEKLATSPNPKPRNGIHKPSGW